MALGADDPVTVLRGVGPARSRQLAAAGVYSLRDLLLHLPGRYEDRRHPSPVAALDRHGGEVTVAGELYGLRQVRTRRRGLTLTQGRLRDHSGELRVVWFNRPWLARQVTAGQEYVLHGRLRAEGRSPELLNPSVLSRQEFRPGLVAVYPALGEVGPAAVSRLIDDLLQRLDPRTAVAESLPSELLARRGLPPLGEALAWLHRPPPDADRAALEEGSTPAHGRLVYGELFELQQRLAERRLKRRARRKRQRYRIDDRVRRVARQLLPFRLTGAQRRVLGEIVSDLQRPWPMLRLLQGDVGCGKTIVAALSAAVAVENGLQVAFMAPTELLAEQHHGTLSTLLGGRYRLELLTAATDAPDEVRRRLGDGELQIVVGTHALIQDDTRFARLGLALIDEQHRFGVEQREALATKGEAPDILVMTATPIPRSLALTVYGDLDLSVIDELPPGRRAVRTEVLPAREHRSVYRQLRDAVRTGERAYVVLPLIERSEAVRASSLESREAEIRRLLAGCRVEVLHGRLARPERMARMQAFFRGEVDVLLATTVIEVGVDVPEASWMVIESAERFGLSQLHQLRGRVGRGDRESRCIALHGRLGEEAEVRLAAFAASSDGFRLAEEDLRIRGPGELLGTRQAGRAERWLSNPLRHWQWLEAAREDAAELLLSEHREAKEGSG